MSTEVIRANETETGTRGLHIRISNLVVPAHRRNHSTLPAPTRYIRQLVSNYLLDSEPCRSTSSKRCQQDGRKGLVAPPWSKPLKPACRPVKFIVKIETFLSASRGKISSHRVHQESPPPLSPEPPESELELLESELLHELLLPELELPQLS